MDLLGLLSEEGDGLQRFLRGAHRKGPLVNSLRLPTALWLCPPDEQGRTPLNGGV